MDRMARRELLAGAGFRVRLSIGRPVRALQAADLLDDDDGAPLPGDDVFGPEVGR